jgi:hypothetical protein
MALVDPTEVPPNFITRVGVGFTLVMVVCLKKGIHNRSDREKKLP